MLPKIYRGNIVSLSSHDCSQKTFFKDKRFRIRYTGVKTTKFRLFAESNDDKWKLLDMDTSSMHETLNSWLSRTQRILTEVTTPLVKSRSGKSGPKSLEKGPSIDAILTERTVDNATPHGKLSLAAVVSIEQFSRMNGLTGYKMQKMYQSQYLDSGYSFGRNLVEYCCFRYLSRACSTPHPSLKEPAFQQLIFITMLAWENPYVIGNDVGDTTFQDKLVSEDAFLRIAPKIPGVADNTTAGNLFKALCGDEQGLSLSSWMSYVCELLKVHEGRASYEVHPQILLTEERILCVGSSKKQPVLKWEGNLAWPGKVILSEKALYFEAVGIGRKKDLIRFDLTKLEAQVRKTKVGPLGSELFDSALCVSYGPRSESWVLEFVDLGGESRRDVWHAFISEVISLHGFIRDYGPEYGDLSISQVYGASEGYEMATHTALNGIARLQVLQYVHKVLDDPIRLVQFSYLKGAPYGDIVFQALALNFWGGPLVNKFMVPENQVMDVGKPNVAGFEVRNHVYDYDGSTYLKKWMRSPSWFSNASINFWKKTSTRKGMILSKNLVVGDLTLVEKAASIFRGKSQVVENTQATIDAALLKGIPSNIDLFKGLMLPLTVTATNFEKLRRWESPLHTISFLVLVYSIIFRNFLPYLFPTMLMVVSATILTLKGFKQQGRLGRLFGAVTIYDQAPSNTIQKIIAVKDALRDLETYLQNLNIILLKIRTIFLGGQPEVATEVAVVLMITGVVLIVVPFRYVMTFVMFDLFTRELDFRKEMVKRFSALLRDRWKQVPAAPVVVLPFNSDESKSVNQNKEEGSRQSSQLAD